MTISISSLYGKKIMSNTGRWVGEVGEVVIDVENRCVSHLLLGKIDASKTGDVIKSLFKNSVEYNRVKKVSESIVVSGAS
ncbi:MAG: PRC-barrel domain-containing protein [Candidatus Micrarchaeota archaeon]|nr:PRC-barrel domain-containing protein [Candidatus Micrarchaeota archaeon]